MDYLDDVSAENKDIASTNIIGYTSENRPIKVLEVRFIV